MRGENAALITYLLPGEPLLVDRQYANLRDIGVHLGRPATATLALKFLRSSVFYNLEKRNDVRRRLKRKRGDEEKAADGGGGANAGAEAAEEQDDGANDGRAPNNDGGADVGEYGAGMTSGSDDKRPPFAATLSVDALSASYVGSKITAPLLLPPAPAAPWRAGPLLVDVPNTSPASTFLAAELVRRATRPLSDADTTRNCEPSPESESEALPLGAETDDEQEDDVEAERPTTPIPAIDGARCPPAPPDGCHDAP